jgi:hypothetical protein
LPFVTLLGSPSVAVAKRQGSTDADYEVNPQPGRRSLLAKAEPNDDYEPPVSVLGLALCLVAAAAVTAVLLRRRPQQPTNAHRLAIV